MKLLIFLFLFIGMFMVMHSIYEKKLKEAKQNVKVEYKFIPRSLYEEQLGDPDLFSKVGTIFDGQPWDYVNKGVDAMEKDKTPLPTYPRST
jgi:hypothetical protein